MKENTERLKPYSGYLEDMEQAGILTHRDYEAFGALPYKELLAKLDTAYKGFEGGLCLEDLAELLLAAAGVDLEEEQGATA